MFFRNALVIFSWSLGRVESGREETPPEDNWITYKGSE